MSCWLMLKLTAAEQMLGCLRPGQENTISEVPTQSHGSSDEDSSRNPANRVCWLNLCQFMLKRKNKQVPIVFCCGCI